MRPMPPALRAQAARLLAPAIARRRDSPATAPTGSATPAAGGAVPRDARRQQPAGAPPGVPRAS